MNSESSESRPWYRPWARIKYRPVQAQSRNGVSTEPGEDEDERAILFINIALTIAASTTSYTKFNGQDVDSVPLYNGQCSTTKNWARGLHLLINVLSTLMLTASNYCMQCLSAPSRADVDRAHSQGKWLDIGVPSVKNLLFVSRRRLVLWIVLLVTSLPVHLIYNSAVFSALGTNQYSVLFSSSDFSYMNSSHDAKYTGCFQTNVAANMTDFFAEMTRLENLTKQECIDTYAVDYLTDRGTLVLVSNNTYVWMCDYLPPGSGQNPCRKDQIEPYNKALSFYATPWVVDYMTVTVPATERHSEMESLGVSKDEYHDTWDLQKFLRTWPQETAKNSSWAQQVKLQKTGDNCALSVGRSLTSDMRPFPVDYCLSKKVEERCQLLFSLPICITVILCNLVKVACMVLTADDKRNDIILTVGDALSSFLSTPDPTTDGKCLLFMTDVKSPTPQKASNDPIELQDFSIPKHAAYLPPKRRWRQAVSIPFWLTTLTLCILLIMVTAYLLSLGIHGVKDTGDSTSLSNLWTLGFGSATSSTLINLCFDTCPGLIPIVLLANTPQIIISAVYFLYNNIPTKMLLAAEYTDYAPHGLQRSTYYLSLPYRYSIPLMAVSAILHWIVSQSLFFVQIIPYDIHGNAVPEDRLLGCGYSPIAIFRLRARMPLAVSCSVATSAACHPLVYGEHALNPVMWGEVVVGGDKDGLGGETVDDDKVEDRECGHCSFTSGEVVAPRDDRLYP
ncbi:hypothetical protein BDV25DRAFT_128292 [Aspergillus avenaceus]|uniref:DUF6536 domain-containing protein n=1 Tax=Aspergillus avenaceus TaxID=36643 RepID=A0A5N6U156_ASPAV|nr:hypothetical protein BDV25DRAFT_128292 [Aspergillus avenaceus]